MRPETAAALLSKHTDRRDAGKPPLATLLLVVRTGSGRFGRDDPLTSASDARSPPVCGLAICRLV